MNTRIARLVGSTLACAALIAGAPSASNAAISPYTADANTLHLWHFDGNGTDAAGSENLTASGGATFAGTALSGFGSSLDVSATLSQNNGAYGTDDISPVGFVADATTGAFTMEALVRPTIALGSVTDQMQIISMENEGALATRSFQFRISNSGNLEFINVAAGPVTVATAVPTTGANAYAVGEWFHVAATYNGNEGGTDNFKLYWTKVTEGTTRANVLAVGTMSADLSGASDFAVGNESRDPREDSWVGQVDEARISDNVRAGDGFIFSKSFVGQTLLADNFNTASSGINDDLGSRQSGLLATTNYNVNTPVTVASNQAQFGPTSAISPNVDFNTGTAAVRIAAGGGFIIDFDVNPVSDASDTGADGDWLAVSIGRTLANSTSTAPGITQGDVDFGLLFRDSGSHALWDGGVNTNTPTVTEFDTTPIGGEFYNVRIVVNTADANSGTAASVSLFVNGVQFDLTDGAGLNYNFTWDGNNTNYISFENRGNTSVFDNLWIAAIPAPAALPAGLAMLGLIATRRRR